MNNASTRFVAAVTLLLGVFLMYSVVAIGWPLYYVAAIGISTLGCMGVLVVGRRTDLKAPALGHPYEAIVGAALTIITAVTVCAYYIFNDRVALVVSVGIGVVVIGIAATAAVRLWNNNKN